MVHHCIVPSEAESILKHVVSFIPRIADCNALLARAELAAQQTALLDAIIYQQGLDPGMHSSSDEVHTVIVACDDYNERIALLDTVAKTPAGKTKREIITLSPASETTQTIDALNRVPGVDATLVTFTGTGEPAQAGMDLGLLLAQRLARGTTISMATTIPDLAVSACIRALKAHHHLAIASQKDGGAVWQAWTQQRFGLSLATKDTQSLSAFTETMAFHMPSVFLTSAGEEEQRMPLHQDQSAKVSVIIPVFNHLSYTLQCLDSIEAATNHQGLEIIVIDNGSGDGTAEALAGRPDVIVITNPENRGFTEACNQGAAKATGDYLLFLNNDTIVRPGWLEHLLACLENDLSVWAVGSRLIYPNGELQEAAAVVFNDATASNYGRHESPDLPKYNRPCVVDYCSGASLLVRSEIFDRLGGFDMRYAPAYYEETDLCFSIRMHGGKVAYEPASAVVHFGSTTAGLPQDKGARRYLYINREKFIEKWAHVLAGHEAPPANGEVVLTNARAALGHRVGNRTPLSADTVETQFDPKILAYYLPQFHQIPENDEWWGEGFTEWVNVQKAKPAFPGHMQPLVSSELGTYDLSDVEVMRRQAELARTHGIHGFCFYHYWFNARRILEKPVDNFLASDIDMPFCLCWANENWSRNWDGGNRETLIEQRHSLQDDEHHFQLLLQFITDPRYIRVYGKPLILVYRASLLDDPVATTTLWRRLAQKAGLPGLHLCKVESLSVERHPPASQGFDAAVEFQPDWRNLGEHRSDPIYGRHRVYDYNVFVDRQKAKPQPPYDRYPCVTPRWDNTARRAKDSVVLLKTSPEAYGEWLKHVLEEIARAPVQEQLVFINAWNEWGEGCTLEPDLVFQRDYLKATKAAKAAVTHRLKGGRS
jgi:GT2 family glycosyltransferase